jgi:hypothetical protein
MWRKARATERLPKHFVSFYFHKQRRDFQIILLAVGGHDIAFSRQIDCDIAREQTLCFRTKEDGLSIKQDSTRSYDSTILLLPLSRH